MQDVAGRGDRVGAEHERQAGGVGRDREAVGEGGVAGDVAERTGATGGRSHLVADGEDLGGLAERPAGIEGAQVGGEDLRLGRELGLQEPAGAVGGSGVQPGQQAEREHVGRALGILAAKAQLGQRGHGHRRQRHGVQPVGVEAAVLQRVGRVAHLGQVAFGEAVGVRDHRAAVGQVRQVGLEGGRVHGYQDVGLVARGQHLVIGELQLEARHAGKGSGGGADLGGEVGERGEVVAQRRGLGREPVPGELHAVAGVPGEADDDVVERGGGCHCWCNNLSSG